MARPADKPVPMTPLQRCKKIHAAVKNERTSWDPHWRDLADYILPRRGRFLTTDANRGEKRNQKIIDSTATMAARTLAAGMTTGITSPARPWFKLATPDGKLAEVAGVKAWLDDVATAMRDVLLRSNVYNALPVLYGDIGVFGTAAMSVLEDDEDVIRCETYPVGSYYLACSPRGVVDTFVREFTMTVRQVVDMFGYEACSERVRGMWRAGSNLEDKIEVVQVIAPNGQHDPKKLGAKHKAWGSWWYEMGGNEERFLRESGFDEFPIMAPRWNVTGEDVYGSSPAMDVLGDVKALQLMDKRMAQAVEKMVFPPMVGHPSLQNRDASTLPGHITYAMEADGKPAFRPVHEVNFKIEAAILAMQERRAAIRAAMFADLFLMLANDARTQPPTAEEIRERKEEKLLMLGPVLERLNDELLDPFIDRVFAIMLRRGLIPEPPPEIQGEELRVEYISIMAQAQRLQGLGGIDRLVGFAVNVAAQTKDLSVLDKVDFEQAVDEYGTNLGVPARIIRSDDAVSEMRKQRAQAEQRANQAALMESMSKTAKTLSETNTTDTNALTDLQAAAGDAMRVVAP